MNTDASGPGGQFNPDDLSPEDLAKAQDMAAELAAARERVASAPAHIVVANHAMGLYELAAIHLSQDPPGLAEAKLAIDATSAIIDKCGARLGELRETLEAARSQIQMLYVQRSTATTETTTETDATDSTDSTSTDNTNTENTSN